MKTSKARKGNLKNVLQPTVVIFILINKSFGPLISIWEAFESFVQSFQMLSNEQQSADFDLKQSRIRKVINNVLVLHSRG